RSLFHRLFRTSRCQHCPPDQKHCSSHGRSPSRGGREQGASQEAGVAGSGTFRARIRPQKGTAGTSRLLPYHGGFARKGVEEFPESLVYQWFRAIETCVIANDPVWYTPCCSVRK